MKKYLFIFALVIIALSNVRAQQQQGGLCASEMAVFFNQSIDTIPGGRGVAFNHLLWDNGATILVKFMPGGSEKLRNQVMSYAKLWEQYANITFKFVPDNYRVTQLRVRLSDNGGAESAIGTAANMFSQQKATMNLDTIAFLEKSTPEYWRATVIHEFGHALGLLHEQGYPGSIRWNKANMYDYYKRTNNWDEEKVNSNVFAVFDQFYTNGTQYDSKSIMHYGVQSWQTLDGVSIPSNLDLSEGDKRLISSLYPKLGQRRQEVPRVSLSNVSESFTIVNDPERHRILILPTFDIETNNQLGEVYWVAEFQDENKKPIKTNNEVYSWGGVTATYAKINLLPESKASFNRTEPNFALSMPLDQIPTYQGKKVHIVMKTYLFDKVNNKLIGLYFSNATAYNMPAQ